MKFAQDSPLHQWYYHVLLDPQTEVSLLLFPPVSIQKLYINVLVHEASLDIFQLLITDPSSQTISSHMMLHTPPPMNWAPVVFEFVKNQPIFPIVFLGIVKTPNWSVISVDLMRQTEKSCVQQEEAQKETGIWNGSKLIPTLFH